jgi:hypothetical protein
MGYRNTTSSVCVEAIGRLETRRSGNKTEQTKRKELRQARRGYLNPSPDNIRNVIAAATTPVTYTSYCFIALRFIPLKLKRLQASLISECGKLSLLASSSAD